jgi:hypothetical protein
VVLQTDDARPLAPCSLLVAYAEETVLPVVSDMDALVRPTHPPPHAPPPPALRRRAAAARS